MSDLVVFFEPKGDCIVLNLQGSADMDNAAKLDTAIDDAIKQKPRIVVVDLSGIRYMNSLAIGAIVRLHLSLKKHSGQARIAAPSAYAESVLKASKITSGISVYPTSAAALV